jgi:hypothetical protein
LPKQYGLRNEAKTGKEIMVVFSRRGASAYLTACVPLVALVLIAQDQAAVSAPLSPIPMSVQKHDALDIVPIRAAGRRGGAAVGPRGGAVVHRGGAVAGPRGGAAVRRTAVVGPRGNAAVRRTAVVGGRGAWARPGWYRWPAGGAIAAGAALGFVTAATAAAWAGAAPASGMCWYYTDASRTQGFWDYCP